jgi:hypothetical protein
MMKREPQPPPGSVGFLTCSTCCTEGDNNNSTSTLTSSKNIILENLSSLPELINQDALFVRGRFLIIIDFEQLFDYSIGSI